MKPIVYLLLLVFVLPALPTLAHENEGDHVLEISDVWARKTRRTSAAAVYLRIHNPTGKADRLLSASSERASMTSLHMSEEKDGIMQMEMQDSVAIPEDGTVLFEPGGLHIMMMGLSAPLEEGELFPVQLTFETAGKVTVFVTVTGMSGPNRP